MALRRRMGLRACQEEEGAGRTRCCGIEAGCARSGSPTLQECLRWAPVCEPTGPRQPLNHPRGDLVNLLKPVSNERKAE
jgi:hypothetical protein